MQFLKVICLNRGIGKRLTSCLSFKTKRMSNNLRFDAIPYLRKVELIYEKRLVWQIIDDKELARRCLNLKRS